MMEENKESFSASEEFKKSEEPKSESFSQTLNEPAHERVKEPEVKAEEPKVQVVEERKDPVKEDPVNNNKEAVNPDKFWKITTIVLIIVLGVFLLRGGFDGGNEVTGEVVAPTAVAPTAAPAAPTVDMTTLLDDDYVRGDKNAPVTIVEFSDYECPFCGRFYSQSYNLIKTNYIDTGKVKYVFRDFPLSFHPQAEPAAIAANCAGEQGKYYEFHDKIFDNQATLNQANLKVWAQDLSLNIGEWETCLSDPAQRAEVQKDMRDGGAAGVRGTPAFFINGKMISGAQPFNVFQQEIDAALNS